MPAAPAPSSSQAEQKAASVELVSACNDSAPGYLIGLEAAIPLDEWVAEILRPPNG